jgi:hypothetical protein
VELSAPLESAWQDSGLRERARALGRRLAATDSAARAADAVERVAQESATAREDQDHEYAISEP